MGVDPRESVRLQTLRGLACLLLVSFHVIGTDTSHGLAVAAGSPYRDFTNLFIHLRMPLFVFLSGFVYAYRPIDTRGAARFARRKMQRLVIPFVVVVTLYFVVQQLTPGVNNTKPWSQMWQIYVYSYNHFWFLQAIILLFALLFAVEHFGLLKTFRGFLIAMGVTLAAHFSLDLPNLFSADRALYLAPFFLLGIGANRFRGWHAPSTKLLVGAAFAVLMLLQIWAALDDQVAPRSRYFGTALSFASILAAFYWLPGSRWLAWVGGFSYTIYLYHVFFSAGTRIVLHQAHITNLEANFVVGCLVALIGPILFELAVKRYAWARLVLLGQPEDRRAQNRIPAARPVLQSRLRSKPHSL